MSFFTCFLWITYYIWQLVELYGRRRSFLVCIFFPFVFPWGQQPASAGSLAAAGTMDFDYLTRQHGVKVQCSASVEECSLAIGEVIGHEHVKSASRMNNAVVAFLGTVEKAREVIEKGIVIHNTLTPVLPLSSPSKKIIISNVPPFIKDDLIERELQRFGRLVSSIRKIYLGCKSPLLKHVVSFRRQVYMVLNNGEEELNLAMKFKVGGFEYVVFATSDSALKCFSCSSVGHIARDCPQRTNDSTEQPSDGLNEPCASSLLQMPLHLRMVV